MTSIQGFDFNAYNAARPGQTNNTNSTDSTNSSNNNQGQSQSVNINDITIDFTTTGSPDTDAQTVKSDYESKSGQSISLSDVKSQLQSQLGDPSQKGASMDCSC